MTIAITGASGPLGRATADLVLAAVDPSELVLTTRTPESLAAYAERGVQVRRADFADPASLAAALAGVETLLLISTDALGTRQSQQRDAVATARAAGVRHVAYTSVVRPERANVAAVVPDHIATEEALRASGLAWTMLRNNLYAHLQLPVLEQAAASGRLVTNAGAGGTAYVTREDCAAVAAAVLTSAGHEGRAYDVTGPQSVTAADLAALAAELGGRPVEVVEVDDAGYAAGLRGAGLPAEVADLLTSIGTATREGFFGEVSTAVADLTGHQATALADLVRAARAA